MLHCGFTTPIFTSEVLYYVTNMQLLSGTTWAFSSLADDHNELPLLKPCLLIVLIASAIYT